MLSPTTILNVKVLSPSHSLPTHPRFLHLCHKDECSIRQLICATFENEIKKCIVHGPVGLLVTIDWGELTFLYCAGRHGLFLLCTGVYIFKVTVS